MSTTQTIKEKVSLLNLISGDDAPSYPAASMDPKDIDNFKNDMSLLLSKAIENGLPEENETSFNFVMRAWAQKDECELYGNYMYHWVESNGRDAMDRAEFVKNKSVPIPSLLSNRGKVNGLEIKVYSTNVTKRWEKESENIEVTINGSIDGVFSQEDSHRYLVDREEFQNLLKSIRDTL